MSNAYRSTLAGGGAAVGDATAADVLSGKTFSGAVGSGVVGTMVNNGAVSGTATPSTPYTIPAGYHNGSGTVTASGAAYEEFMSLSGGNLACVMVNADGTYSIGTAPADEATINAAAKNISIHVDTSTPSITFTAKAAGSFTYTDSITGQTSTVTKETNEVIYTRGSMTAGTYVAVMAL